jgi:hypothetical protein
VNDALAQRLGSDGEPERRFRFASPCREDACVQWTGERCGVIDRVNAAATPVELRRLPTCAIRRTCRWYAQSSTRACDVCSYVVTDQRPAEAEVR